MGDIKGFSLCQRGPELTHLLFADDSHLFCRATGEECGKFFGILDCYEKNSGQKVNKNKTTIFYSLSTPENTKQEIKTALVLQEVAKYEKYLGLPSLVGRKKNESSNFIKEKVWQKLHGCEGKLLSQAGHEVLMKAVIQAISTYNMGCFKLLRGLCHDIEALIKNFWWVNGEIRGRSIGLNERI